VIANNSTNINKIFNYISLLLIQHEKGGNNTIEYNAGNPGPGLARLYWLMGSYSKMFLLVDFTEKTVG
jgi:hypothetical protein